MPPINIPRDEHGKVRLFALSLSDDAAQALHDGEARQPLTQALGADAVDATHVEIFRVADLGAMGLAGYLREGIDVDEAMITRDGSKLAAVDGWVMLVHSAAFANVETVIDPSPELTLIGTYGPPAMDRAQIPLQSDAAAPYTGVLGDSPPTAPKGRAGGSLIVVGLAVLVLLILWWAFS